VTWLQRVVAVTLGVVVAVSVAVLTRAPAQFVDGEDALIRLSWRLEGLAVQECQALSAEELANLPVHMRNPAACIGQIADYELSVRLSDTEVLLDTVAPGGARGDRPIYVLADLPVAAGTHDLSVRFSALVPETYEGDDPVEYTWSGIVEPGFGEIVLITLNEAGTAFVIRSRNSER
jgi:hypothetical protein